MALHKGIWDPQPGVTNIKGTNLKSLIKVECIKGTNSKSLIKVECIT